MSIQARDLGTIQYQGKQSVLCTFQVYSRLYCMYSHVVRHKKIKPNKMKIIKYLLILIIGFLVLNPIYGQEQKNFKERHFLYLKNAKYLISEKDESVFLHKKKKVGKKIEQLYFSVSNGDTINYYKEVDSIEIDTFLVFEFNGLWTSTLKGDFKIEQNQLVFHPWKFTSKNPQAEKILKELNAELDEYTLFIPIPDRNVIKIRFNSFQYGALTLPAKIYLMSKSDSLVNNIQTGVNLNFMLGFKSGYKKYYQQLGEKEASSYEQTWSVNFIFGISKINLSKENTTPNLKNKYSVAGFSTGLAIGHQYKNIGLYLALGFDIPMSEYGDDWNFKNKPWIGIGVGLGL